MFLKFITVEVINENWNYNLFLQSFTFIVCKFTTSFDLRVIFSKKYENAITLRCNFINKY